MCTPLSAHRTAGRNRRESPTALAPGYLQMSPVVASRKPHSLSEFCMPPALKACDSYHQLKLVEIECARAIVVLLHYFVDFHFHLQRPVRHTDLLAGMHAPASLNERALRIPSGALAPAHLGPTHHLRHRPLSRTALATGDPQYLWRCNNRVSGSQNRSC